MRRRHREVIRAAKRLAQIVALPHEIAYLGEPCQQHLEQAGIIGGYALGDSYSDMPNDMLFCVTETRTKEDIDYLVQVLKEVRVCASRV